MPYGLGAESIDAALNYYVASNYSPRVMNFLHCFYGVGAIISPNIMAFALLKANWHMDCNITRIYLIRLHHFSATMES